MLLSSQNKPPYYFSNIQDAVNLMLANFKSNNNEQEYLDPNLEETLKLLTKHGSTTTQLIHTYFKHRISEQNTMSASQYGTLAVTCYFNENNLTVQF
jgi:hypothetical protein